MSDTNKLPPLDDLIEHFEFLDELRDSGKTNMYGARPFLEEEFALRAGMAGAVLVAWMRTFSQEPIHDRARNAIEGWP